MLCQQLLRVLGLFLGLIAFIGIIPAEVEGYGGECHQYITGQAAEIFSFPELDDFLLSVLDGALHEDYEDHVWGHGGDTLTITHFWDADGGDFTTQWWGAYEYANAWVKSRILLSYALDEYELYISSGSFNNILWAYHYLGHAAHLLADQGVPAHVHVDYHWPDDDCYEDWMAGEDTPEFMGCHNWNEGDATARYGESVDLPSDRLMSIINSMGVEIWFPKELFASQYYLMYMTNQISDYFASDNEDGDMTDRHGWVDYSGFPNVPTVDDDLDDNDLPEPDNDNNGNLSRIARRSYLHAIWATAALYQAWRDSLDHVAPTTEISISGSPTVHDNWRPGDVEVTLSADDDSEGSATHDSGVHEIKWKISYGDWTSYNGDVTNPIPVFAEGINEFRYQSMDRFGNWEDTKLEIIKIDESPPDITIISPTSSGFYLTSDTLTIDFEATDAVSGIFSVSADLDGIQVYDGDILDLTSMCGYHTLTVTASDFAGNSTTESVTFSVKLHATIDLKPDKLNVKSKGKSIVAYIEFPAECDISPIDISTVRLMPTFGWFVKALPIPTDVGDYDLDGEPDWMVKFSRESTIFALVGATGNINMSVFGEFDNGIEFYGTEIVEVFNPGSGP